MAKVACNIANGMTICLWKKGYDDGTGDGVAPMIRDGVGIRLNGPSSLNTGTSNSDGAGLEPGFTEVDDQWITKWFEQNKSNPLVDADMIYLVNEDGTPVVSETSAVTHTDALGFPTAGAPKDPNALA